jgi:hypothetical protein
MKNGARWLSGFAATLLAVAMVTGNAVAQQSQNTVAKLGDLQGNVLVSQGDAMVTGIKDQRLPVGTRVVTTAGAKATINYDVGCDIRLNENQRFTVRSGPCAVLLAEVESLGPAAGAIGGGAAAGSTAAASGTVGILGTTTAGFVAAGAVIGVGLYETFKNHQISPN